MSSICIFCDSPTYFCEKGKYDHKYHIRYEKKNVFVGDEKAEKTFLSDYKTVIYKLYHCYYCGREVGREELSPIYSYKLIERDKGWSGKEFLPVIVGELYFVEKTGLWKYRVLDIDTSVISEGVFTLETQMVERLRKMYGAFCRLGEAKIQSKGEMLLSSKIKEVN